MADCRLECRYFAGGVLPDDPGLYAELMQADAVTANSKKCAMCGKIIKSSSNRREYCPECSKKRAQLRAREAMRNKRKTRAEC